jgi:osmotically-inducible protein OsmY
MTHGAVPKPAAAIQQAVLEELKWDSRVSQTEVGVEVESGIVTLTGSVDTWHERCAAEEAAHRAQGVLDVANDIVVRPPGTLERTATGIAKAVRHALDVNAGIPRGRVTSTVSGGVVRLDGRVDTRGQRDASEQAVRRLAGVLAVVNRIEV